MKYEYTIYLRGYDGEIFQSFTFTNYDDVQNLIGYMIEGTSSLKLEILRRTIDE